MTSPKRAAPGSASRSRSGAGPAADFLTSPVGVFVVAGMALVVVAALVLASGGVASPTSSPPTLDPVRLTAAAVAPTSVLPVDPKSRAVNREVLLDCNGRPCPSTGRSDAKVTLLEISDYACTHCRDLHLDTLPVIEAEYVAAGKARLVSRPYGFTPETQAIAAAALCADVHGRYFEFQREAFASEVVNAKPGTEEAILAAGRKVIEEADAYATFEQCVKDKTYVQEVGVLKFLSDRAGLEYTPSLFVDDLLIEGAESIDVYRSRIDRALRGDG